MTMRKIGSHKKRTPAKKTTHRKKRRVSGVGDLKGLAMTGLAVVAGMLTGRKLNEIAVGIEPSITPLMSGAGQAAIGAFLPKFIKGPFMANFSLGMMGQGLTVVALDLLPPSIVNGISGNLGYRVAGTGNISVITGPSKRLNGQSALPVVAGPGNRISNNVYSPAGRNVLSY